VRSRVLHCQRIELDDHDCGMDGSIIDMEVRWPRKTFTAGTRE
jgi:hypothetical protein